MIPAKRRIGVGTSLGALSMLHAGRRHPGTFDALFLQSGSFFTRDLDPQEQGTRRFDEVAEFVLETHCAVNDVAGVPTVMMFVQSLHGISHNKIEDTKEEHLEQCVAAFDRLADKTIAWISRSERREGGGTL